MARVIDVNRLEIVETITVNFSGGNFRDEYIRSVGQLRAAFTRNGIQCGLRRTTYDTERDFVVRLIVRIHVEANLWLETSILIRKYDCYAIAVYAGGNWLVVSDAIFRVIGARRAPFSSSYTNFVAEHLGPGMIYSAVNNLNSSNALRYRVAFFNLVAMFLEPARLDGIYGAVLDTFDTPRGPWYSMEVDGLVRELPKYWGKMSTSLLDMFVPQGQAKWSASYASEINLPEVNAVDPAERQQQIQSQIDRCFELIHIIKRREN